jgi:hypothetical protein
VKRGPEASGEIVGREAELETARAFIDSVCDGPAALFIVGEAGIGKTSVWSSCLHYARRTRGQRARVTGRGTDPGGRVIRLALARGPVFVQVVSGTLTLYQGDDPTCSPTVIAAGNGFVEPG